MSANLYGHNPPPTMTRLEEKVYELLDDVFRHASFVRKFLEGYNKASISVALVRLRNRGLVESIMDETTLVSNRPAKLWRRVQK